MNKDETGRLEEWSPVEEPVKAGQDLMYFCVSAFVICSCLRKFDGKNLLLYRANSKCCTVENNEVVYCYKNYGIGLFISAVYFDQISMLLVNRKTDLNATSSKTNLGISSKFHCN